MLRRVSHRLGRRAADRGRFATFQAEVEPELASRPRVHRYAEVPTVGDAGTAPVELGVCVDLEGSGDATATRASLEAQTVAPAAVAEGSGAAVLDALNSPWIVVVRAGDRLAPTALERLGQAVALAPGAALVTCDDDLLDRAGARAEPRCAPGPSPDLLAAHDHTGALLTVAREPARGAAPGPEAGPEVVAGLEPDHLVAGDVDAVEEKDLGVDRLPGLGRHHDVEAAGGEATGGAEVELVGDALVETDDTAAIAPSCWRAARARSWRRRATSGSRCAWWTTAACSPPPASCSAASSATRA